MHRSQIDLVFEQVHKVQLHVVTELPSKVCHFAEVESTVFIGDIAGHHNELELLRLSSDAVEISRVNMRPVLSMLSEQLLDRFVLGVGFGDVLHQDQWHEVFCEVLVHEVCYLGRVSHYVRVEVARRLLHTALARIDVEKGVSNVLGLNQKHEGLLHVLKLRLQFVWQVGQVTPCILDIADPGNALSELSKLPHRFGEECGDVSLFFLRR